MKRIQITRWLFVALAALLLPASSRADFVILDDLIVDGSACVGFDCVNGEPFSFDTIRLKEHNLRIKFDDTSVAASFPRNDWQLTANASANGGASKFSIDDISNNRTPFTVEANARSHSLYVDDGGRIGIRTSTPSTEIHVIDGDTPTLRLQQDGSSGFAPQTWDVAGNETNFFIRDVTNGSTLPLRIRPGAPSNSIFVHGEEGDLGIGTASPNTDVHVRRSSGDADLRLEATSGTSRLRLQNGGDIWNTTHNSGDNDYEINSSDGAGVEFQLDFNSGDLTLEGDVITSNCPAGCGPADFVFDPDYELMPLAELAAFVRKEKHLPNIPSAKELEAGVKLTWMQMRLLEKIEELALYTIAQQEPIDALNLRILEQQRHIDALTERLAALEDR